MYEWHLGSPGGHSGANPHRKDPTRPKTHIRLKSESGINMCLDLKEMWVLFPDEKTARTFVKSCMRKLPVQHCIASMHIRFEIWSAQPGWVREETWTRSHYSLHGMSDGSALLLQTAKVPTNDRTIHGNYNKTPANISAQSLCTSSAPVGTKLWFLWRLTRNGSWPVPISELQQRLKSCWLC